MKYKRFTSNLKTFHSIDFKIGGESKDIVQRWQY